MLLSSPGELRRTCEQREAEGLSKEGKGLSRTLSLSFIPGKNKRRKFAFAKQQFARLLSG